MFDAQYTRFCMLTHVHSNRMNERPNERMNEQTVGLVWLVCCSLNHCVLFKHGSVVKVQLSETVDFDPAPGTKLIKK